MVVTETTNAYMQTVEIKSINRFTVNLRHKLVKGITKVLAPKLFEDYQYSKFDFDYCFRVHQLVYLCTCLGEAINFEGAIVELGVYQGRTTVFLNKFLDSKLVEKAYYAFDTFSGFTEEDKNFEVANRRKEYSHYDTLKFDKKSFEKIMRRNNINRVIPIEADVNKIDLTTIGPVCFALLDVDLYLPMKKSLKEIYKILSPGGIIVVDDCVNSNDYDGSDQAYREFMQEIGKPVEIVYDKLGIVRKPALSQN